MAGMDWNAPIGADAGKSDFRSKFPEVFGGAGESAVPTQAAPSAPPVAESVAEPEAESTYRKDMPWSDYAVGALKNAPASGARVAKGLYDAVVNYEDTGRALGTLGAGLVSKANTALGGEDRSEGGEQMVDAIVGDLEKRWSDPAKSFYDDPFGIGLDVASVAPVIGAAGRLSGMGKLATTAERVAALGDPINLAAKGAGVASKAISKPISSLARYGQGAASGVPESVLKIASEAGRSGTTPQRNAFLTFARGQGDHRDIAKAAMDAVEELRQATSADYVARKASLTTQELPMNDILSAMNNLKNNLDPHTLGLFPKLGAAISDMERQIVNVANHPNPAVRSAEGLDRLKRSLNDVVSDFQGTQHVGAFGEVPKAVKNTISHFDSGYAEMMERWQKWRNELLDFQRTLGTTDRAAESSRLAKLLSTVKKGDKMSLLRELSSRTQAGHTLPHMIAGATVENLLPNYLRGMGVAGIGMMTGNPLHSAAAAVGASPRIAGLSNYAAGRMAGAAGRIPVVPPAFATNLLTNLEDRQGRKSGGRVSSHEADADQLVRAAERAKKGWSAQTEPLLNHSDESVVQALSVANRSI